MRFLIDGRLLDNKATGISRYTEQIIKGALRKFGEENVSVILHPEFIGHFQNEYRTALSPFNLLDFVRFGRYLNHIDFDVLISPFYANSFQKKRNTKYVLVVHDLMYKIIDNFFSSNLIIEYFAKLYYDLIIKRSLKNSDLTISVSKTTSVDLKMMFNHESIVFGEGINQLMQSELQDDKFGLAENDFYLYVGIDRPHKNVDFLIECFLKSTTDKKLVLCGKHERVFKGERIIQLGFVSDKELDVLYRKCAAFVFPSKYEGFGLPILEALSKGAKVFSSNAGSLQEFSDKYIHFFNPTIPHTLINLFNNYNTLEFNQDGLNEYLSNFNWEKITNDIMTTLDKL